MKITEKDKQNSNRNLKRKKETIKQRCINRVW